MTNDDAVVPPPKARLVAGGVVFVLGWIVTLATVSLLTASALPTSIVPIAVFVLPKVGVLGAIAILGKPGFAYLKKLVFGRLKPTPDVGPTRHRVGVVMFVAAMVLGFLEPYGFFLPDTPRGIRLVVAIDLLLIVSLFVLGGNFWDKIRALFVRGAKVYFPARV
jgi:hypothetical protein